MAKAKDSGENAAVKTEVADDGTDLGENIRIEWRCQDCGETAPGTGPDYMELLKHQKGHHIALYNAESGEMLAVNPKEAMGKGIFLPTAIQPPSESGGGKPLIVQQGYAKVTLTLPVELWTMYDAAAAQGLREEDQQFDDWVAVCIKLMFKYVYGLEFALVPVQTPDEEEAPMAVRGRAKGEK